MKKEIWQKGIVLMIIYQAVLTLQRCGMDLWTFWQDKSMHNYAATDYLINYQGGFVRRGMIGEVLYQLRLHLGVDPLPVLTVLGVACFVGLAFMMLRAFRRKGLPPYILPLVICMGMVFASRKDYGMILLVWAATWTYLHLQKEWTRVVVPTLVLLFLLGPSSAARKAGFFTGIVTLLIALLGWDFAHWQKREAESADEAVVMRAVSPVKSSPSGDNAAKDLFILHEGTKVRLLDTVGSWHNIELSDGRQGWLRASDVEVI